MLLAGGILGTAAGVWLFTVLRSLDQLDLTIALSYVALLTIVGGLMIAESVRAIIREQKGKPVTPRRGGAHTWVHGLPLKMRFKRSKIYVSAIPVWTIGFIIGFVGALMGIGGGFLLVPMLIYFLRVPTATVIGTSMVLTLITMASATVMHAATNHLVDAVLALILMVGGVIGAQFGARAGQNMRGERLRLLLGLLVLAVGLRFAYQIIVQPGDLYSIRLIGGDVMARRAFAMAALIAASDWPAPAGVRRAAGHLDLAPSGAGDVELHRHLDRAVRHGGAGHAHRDGARSAYDIVVTVTGPRQTVVTRRKERMLGIWANAASRTFVNVPTYLHVLANRPFEQIANADTLRRLQIGLDYFLLPQQIGSDIADVVRDDPFRVNFIRLKTEHQLYGQRTNGVTFLTPTLFRAEIRAAGRSAVRQLRRRRQAVRRRQHAGAHQFGVRGRQGRLRAVRRQRGARLRRCSTASPR